MKKTVATFLAICLLLPVISASVVSAAKPIYAIYVAVDGDDNNDGSITSPLASLEAAQEKVREAKNAGMIPGGGIRVYLREGSYFRDNTLVMTQEDSGTKDAPIIYSAYPGEKVTITGGVTMEGKDFSLLSEADKLERLNKDAKGNIYSIDLKQYGVSSLLEAKPRMMALFNDQSMSLARWPNDDYYIVPEVISEGTYLRGYSADKNPPNSPNYIPPEKQKNDPGIIKYDVENISKWTNLEKIYLEGYWGVLWSTDILQIAERDINKKTITFDRATTYSVVHNIARFYAYNVFEEIDAPGEYYIDEETLTMYLYPLEDIKTAKVELTQSEHEFFNMTDVSYVAFSGINFETNAKSAILMKGGSDITIQDCNFSKIQNACIDADETIRLGVASCNFKNIGGIGVSIESGDRQTLTSSECYVENCHFETFSQILRTYNPAIQPYGVGIRMSNNVFHDAPHTAILFNGNDMLIEYNEIYDVLKETDDAGAIYSGRDMTWRGNMIQYNYIHDMDNGQGAHGRAAIYMDDAMSSMTAHGNIFANLQKGFFMGGGREHTIANNIFLKVSDPVPFDARQSAMTHEELFDTETTQTVPLRYQSIPFDSEIWKEKYPDVFEMSTDENPGYPKHNSIYNNAFISSGEMRLNSLVTTWAKRLENNEVFTLKESALEISKDTHNATIGENSKIYTKISEFEKIPTDRIGNYAKKLNDKLSNAVALKTNSPNALANGNKTFVDVNNVSVQPVIQDGRTLVPVRFISESFGANVAWEAETRTATVTLDGRTIVLQIDSGIMLVDGQEQTLDVPAQIISDRTLIPLRALVEGLGKKVYWDDRGLILISNQENLFDTEKDEYLIDDIIRKLAY
ncbi:MAG: hypothetical protein E7399_09055 [Ruminococcaceae bacterium]|nr:hypothetical protein [Oscillospiraceae bacterium]